MKLLCRLCDLTATASETWDSLCPDCGGVMVDRDQAVAEWRAARGFGPDYGLDAPVFTPSIPVREEERYGPYTQREVKAGSGVYALVREEEMA